MSFVVELPSWGSQEYFKDNKGHSYKNMLATPLQLEGSWEVALTEIDYTHTWETLEKEQKISFIWQRDDSHGEFGLKHNIGNNLPSTEKIPDTTDVRVNLLFNKFIDIPVTDRLKFSFEVIHVTIPPGFYQSHKEMIQAIQTTVDQRFADFKEYAGIQQRNPKLITFKYDEVLRKFKITPNYENITIVWYPVYSQINRLLGLYEADCCYSFKSLKNLEVNIGRINRTALMYIYLDVI